MYLHPVKVNIFRYCAKHAYNRIAGLVDVGIITYTAHTVHDIGNFVNRIVAAAYQQMVHRAKNIVGIVHNVLVAVMQRLVWKLNCVFFYLIRKVNSGLHIFKETQNVNILACAQLHAAKVSYIVLGTGFRSGLNVKAAVVVTYCNCAKPCKKAHPCNICRCHIIASAGGKAGMDMEIVFHLYYL